VRGRKGRGEKGVAEGESGEVCSHATQVRLLSWALKGGSLGNHKGVFDYGISLEGRERGRV